MIFEYFYLRDGLVRMKDKEFENFIINIIWE